MFDYCIPLQKPTSMSPKNQELMTSWSYEFGQAVRQLSNRQTTTTKKAGTLPDYMSVRTLDLGDKVALPHEQNAPTQIYEAHQSLEEIEDDPPSVEEIEDVPPPTIEEEPEEDAPFDEDVDFEDVGFEVPHVFDDEALFDQRPTYLLGAVTRSGRAIKMNNKFNVFD